MFYYNILLHFYLFVKAYIHIMRQNEAKLVVPILIAHDKVVYGVPCEVALPTEKCLDSFLHSGKTVGFGSCFLAPSRFSCRSCHPARHQKVCFAVRDLILWKARFFVRRFSHQIFI